MLSNISYKLRDYIYNYKYNARPSSLTSNCNQFDNANNSQQLFKYTSSNAPQLQNRIDVLKPFCTYSPLEKWRGDINKFNNKTLFEQSFISQTILELKNDM